MWFSECVVLHRWDVFFVTAWDLSSLGDWKSLVKRQARNKRLQRLHNHHPPCLYSVFRGKPNRQLPRCISMAVMVKFGLVINLVVVGFWMIATRSKMRKWNLVLMRIWEWWVDIFPPPYSFLPHSGIDVSRKAPLRRPPVSGYAS